MNRSVLPIVMRSFGDGLELLQELGNLLQSEYRAIPADVLISHIASGTFAQPAFHLALQSGDDLSAGES